MAILPDASYIFSITAFIFGAILGSFLNVVIDRLPKAIDDLYLNDDTKLKRAPILKRLSFPSSSCEICHHKLTLLDNIPIISYLLLRGRCRYCHTKIGLRIFCVELASACYLTLLVNYLSFVNAIFAFTFGLIVLALAIIDFKTYYLPDCLVYILLWVGLLHSRINNAQTLFIHFDSVIIVFITFYLIQLGLGKSYLGDGDIKYAASISSWMSPFSIPLFLSIMVCLSFMLFLYYKHTFVNSPKKPVIALGPALSGAGFIVVCYNYL